MSTFQAFRSTCFHWSLIALSLVATVLGGLAKAPWWFWLVGAGTLALLMASDPAQLRASYADKRGLESIPLLLGDLKTWMAATTRPSWPI